MRPRRPYVVNDGQQVMVWDGDQYVAISVAALKDVWVYDCPADPPPDPAVRAAALRRSAEIRGELDRYLRQVGAR